MAAGRPFHGSFVAIPRSPLCLATWTPPAVKQRHLISERFETAALHSASLMGTVARARMMMRVSDDLIR